MAADSVVSIVDGNTVTRRALVRTVVDMDLTACAYASELEFWAQSERFQPGCLLLDLGGEARSGFELLDRLRRQVIHPPVIGLADDPSVPLAVQAMQAGALNFLDKASAAPLLSQAIHQALTFDDRRRREHAAIERASQRYAELQTGERQVLELLVDGLPHQAIAQRLSVSVRTVEVRRARLMRKMHVNSLAELVGIMVRIEALRPHDLRRPPAVSRA